jgi:hypothetical protein
MHSAWEVSYGRQGSHDINLRVHGSDSAVLVGLTDILEYDYDYVGPEIN